MPNVSLEGTRIPDSALHTLVRDNLATVNTADLFGGKTVIVFGLPGAFTPTCSTNHVPRFNKLAPTFANLGVDEIVCVSVNDAFVMDAWAKDQDADKLTLLADGNGTFTDNLGLLVDKSAAGMGKRSWRYSLLVKDGVITKAFIEPNKPGDPFEVSDADTMLQHLDPDAGTPSDLLILTKPGCKHCARAKQALNEAGIAYEEVVANLTMLRAVSDTPTTPRVFKDGQLLGGADELEAWLAQG